MLPYSAECGFECVLPCGIVWLKQWLLQGKRVVVLISSKLCAAAGIECDMEVAPPHTPSQEPLPAAPPRHCELSAPSPPPVTSQQHLVPEAAAAEETELAAAEDTHLPAAEAAPSLPAEESASDAAASEAAASEARGLELQPEPPIVCSPPREPDTGLGEGLGRPITSPTPPVTAPNEVPPNEQAASSVTGAGGMGEDPHLVLVNNFTDGM